MDAWSPDQLKKMQLGGNGQLNSFLKKYGIEKETDIKEKYNSSAAEVCLMDHMWSGQLNRRRSRSGQHRLG